MDKVRSADNGSDLERIFGYQSIVTLISLNPTLLTETPKTQNRNRVAGSKQQIFGWPSGCPCEYLTAAIVIPCINIPCLEGRGT